ncbi:MAG: hypothetical protein SH868_12025 [Bythopirellula sp.]|nr:hypothetical protein [Bythopirellula sp.]
MRVLLGGLVGAAASAAAWFFIEFATKQEFGWLAIAVGLVTGLCVNAAAPAGAAQSYGRAALAVVLTLVAIVGGRGVYAKVMQNMSQVKTVMPAAEAQLPAETAEDAPEGDEAADEAAAPEVVQEDRQMVPAPTGQARLPKPNMNTYKELEVVWMAIAALAAYLTGKGSGKAGPVVVETDAPDGSTPA